MTGKIIIGTRGSDLALWQAHFLKEKLSSLGHLVELKIIKTKGDIIQNLSFDKLEGKGFFTKELEEALLSNDVDVAVHSMKDLPTSHPEGLVIAGVSSRANPSDLLLIDKKALDQEKLLKLKTGAKVGTSSARRKSQIKAFRNDISVIDLRGNVPTRINKLRSEDYDAIILAKAGVERLDLDLSEFELIEFNPKEFIPAPAQGVLAYQLRESDLELRKTFLKIHNPETSQCTNVERGLLKLLDGGCQLPLGAYCEKDNLGNYHAVAALGINGVLRKASISSSTSAGISETLYNELTK